MNRRTPHTETERDPTIIDTLRCHPYYYTMLKKILTLLTLGALALALNGCVAAAGAAAGYAGHKAGYRVQSPLTKEE